MFFIRFIKIEKLIKGDYIIWINFNADSSFGTYLIGEFGKK